MVNEETPADFCTRVDLNTGEESADLGNNPGPKIEFPFEQGMCQPMCPYGMDSGGAQAGLGLFIQARQALILNNKKAPLS
ncbi:Uncharacterised protein [Mycobacteroides abscessus subsp. abscessus]|nr:Uncharacterised protein [Mycobacteroides abscessus subsp. abscessus]